MTWSLSTPADNEKIRLGDDRIREMKDDIEDALSEEHSFPVNSAAPVCYHKFPSGTTAARPAFGNAGRWYYNTDTDTIQRDSGTAWASITSVSPFVSGTVSFFAQTTPPTGWTRSTSQDDRMLRVNASAGAGTGGAWGITLAAENFPHDHGGVTPNGTPADPAHSLTGVGSLGSTGSGGIYQIGGVTHSGMTHTHTVASDNYTHGHTIASTWKPAYKDVIMAAKD